MGCVNTKATDDEKHNTEAIPTKTATEQPAQAVPVPLSSQPDPPKVKRAADFKSLPVTEEEGLSVSQQVKTLEVPGGGYSIRYSSLTKRGYYPEAPNKANQDSFCVGATFGGNDSDHLFGVFDGHGENGTPCSQFSRDKVAENLLRHRLFKTDVPQAFHGAFVSANAQLHRAPVDDTMSGTTGIAVLLRNRELYAANVGDSRAVLAERRGKKLVAVDLSNDQTPFRADECARVRACGARVLTLDQLEGLKNPHVQCWGGEEDDDGDPPRLWVPNGMYPGTAFTRSLGDTVAERIGVTAVPEVLVLPLTEAHPFFVVASDGVFEFLSSQAVVDMVAKHSSPAEACAAIVAESYRLWLQFETRTDDITIIVVMIDNLSGPPPVLSVPASVAAPPSTHPKRRRAVEASDKEEEEPSLPETRPPPKTEEQQASLEGALKGKFLFQTLTPAQRLHLIDSAFQLLKVDSGDIIIRQGEVGDAFFVCEEGEFEVLVSGEPSQEQELGQVVHRYASKGHPCFGDLALMYGTRREATVRAASPGLLWKLTRGAYQALARTKSDVAGGYLDEPASTDLDSQVRAMQAELKEFRDADEGARQLSLASMSRLSWLETLVAGDTGEVGRVRHTSTAQLATLKRLSKGRIQRLGLMKEVLRERVVLHHLSPSPFVPELLTSVSSSTHIGLLFHAKASASLASLIQQEPLSESCARYVAASLVLALHLLHADGVVCRSVAPESVLLDEGGRVQLLDLRFAKQLATGRTHTLCGTPDHLAPEMVLGKGHGQAVDWWALGALIFTLMCGEGPFGPLTDSELQVYTRIASRSLQLPAHWSPACRDVVDQLLSFDPEARLGGSVSALMRHKWFAGTEWELLLANKAPVPPELMARLAEAKKLPPAWEPPFSAQELRRDADSINEQTNAVFDQW